MKRGERVTLLKRIAAALQESPVAEMDFILGQFGMPTSFSWDGSQYDYVLEHAGAGSDEAIFELDEYLQGETSDLVSASPEARGRWEPGAFPLFLSHTHHHAAFAGELRVVMRRWGVDLFVAHDMIRPTAEWRRAIEDALQTCFALAALLTPEFQGSEWCDQEVGVAVGRGLPVVPMMRPNKPHGLIEKYQGVKAGKAETALALGDRLFDLLATHEATRRRMAPAVVRRFRNSPNFDGARKNFTRLRALPKEQWTAEMASDARRGAKENDQIEYGNYENDQIEYGNYDYRPIPQLLEEHLSQVGFPSPPPDDDVPF